MSKLILAFVLALSVPAFGINQIKTTNLLVAATTTATGASVQPWPGVKTFSARGLVSATTGASVVRIEGNNTNSAVAADWVAICSITLALVTTSVGDGCVANADWRYVRARVISISGTDATVNAYMSGAVQ